MSMESESADKDPKKKLLYSAAESAVNGFVFYKRIGYERDDDNLNETDLESMARDYTLDGELELALNGGSDGHRGLQILGEDSAEDMLKRLAKIFGQFRENPGLQEDASSNENDEKSRMLQFIEMPQSEPTDDDIPM